jgi:hypothetical protein
MGTPYFASLAEKALPVAESNLSDIQGEVATLLAQQRKFLVATSLSRAPDQFKNGLLIALSSCTAF